MTDRRSADEGDDPVAGGHTGDHPGEHTAGRVVDDDTTPTIGMPSMAAQPPVADPPVAPPAPPAAEVPPVAEAASAPQERRGRRGRVSKWDRPPDPHDWRFFVGGTGKVLIATGMLLFGFVAYQLWGTGIETARAQSALGSDFEAALAASEPEVPEAVEDAAPDDGPEDRTDDGPAVDEPPDSAPTDPSETPPDDAGGPPVDPVDPADLSEGAIEQAVPAVARGDAIARLDMPTIDKSVFVVPGVDVDDLKDGPGHYPDTPLPGQLGNSAIAGHRTTYGEPFIDLDDLAAGDEIVVTTLYGTFVYDVTGTQVVGPNDTWVVQTTDWDVATLTLTTCHPKWTARERLVISATLDPERSTSVGVPTFYDLDDTPADEIPVDDPTIESLPGVETVAPADAVTDAQPSDAATDAEASDAEPSGDANGSAEPEVTVPPVAVAGSPGAPGDSQSSPEDAFARGWFDDDEAVPQIALWGAALTAIALLAHALSRRVRHDSVGFVVGIAPFLVALYFFFQNVHRLLPPGI